MIEAIVIGFLILLVLACPTYVLLALIAGEIEGSRRRKRKREQIKANRAEEAALQLQMLERRESDAARKATDDFIRDLDQKLLDAQSSNQPN